MPVGVAALPPNFRVPLWLYYRIEKERKPIKIPSLFCHFSVKKLSVEQAEEPKNDCAGRGAYRQRYDDVEFLGCAQRVRVGVAEADPVLVDGQLVELHGVLHAAASPVGTT